uniref:MADF domain-containing protein n=1 Tax=Romanomermis culicivorax TaxID=13658 RepID=A0A915HMS6_ROMCU
MRKKILGMVFIEEKILGNSKSKRCVLVKICASRRSWEMEFPKDKVGPLIEEIQNFPSLWNKKSKDYKDSALRERNWTKIGHLLHLD